MALAGYLILNNVRAAYVEIQTGVLLCTPRLRKSARRPMQPPSKQQQQQPQSQSQPVLCSCGSPADADESGRLSNASTASSSDTGDEVPVTKRALRLLLPPTRRAACCSHRPQGRRHDTTDAYSEEEEEEEEPMPEDEPRGRERVVQLSGYTVEVLEAASEFGADPLVYPFSFQVNTFAPPTRDAAGRRTGGGELVDSLVLSAMDARAKALWVKRIRHWHRFGWRETEFVHADESDFFYLQATMLSRETRRRSCAYPSERPRRPSLATDERASTSACGSPSAATTTTSGRPVRRRFYRAPAGAIGVRTLVPPS